MECARTRLYKPAKKNKVVSDSSESSTNTPTQPASNQPKNGSLHGSQTNLLQNNLNLSHTSLFSGSNLSIGSNSQLRRKLSRVGFGSSEGLLPSLPTQREKIETPVEKVRLGAQPKSASFTGSVGSDSTPPKEPVDEKSETGSNNSLNQIWRKVIQCWETGHTKVALKHLSQMGTSAKREFNVGTCFLKLGEFEKAYVAYYKSTQLDNFNTIAHFQLAGCAWRLADWPNALKHYRLCKEFMKGFKVLNYQSKGLDIRLNLSDIIYNLAMACIISSRWHEADLLVQELSKLEEETTELRQLRSHIKDQNQDIDLSIILFASLYTPDVSMSAAPMPQRTTQTTEKKRLTLNQPTPKPPSVSPPASRRVQSVQKIRIKCRFRDDLRFVLLPENEKTNFELLQRLISEKFFVYNLEIWFDGGTGVNPLKNSHDLQEFFKTGETTLLLSLDKERI